MPADLTHVSTHELVTELSKRECAKQIGVGLYKGYCIKPKYTKTRQALDFDGVAILIAETAISGSLPKPA